MKRLPLIKTIICTVLLVGFYTTLQSQNQQSEFYQLKTYTLDNEKQEEHTDNYLRDAYFTCLKKIGHQQCWGI